MKSDSSFTLEEYTLEQAISHLIDYRGKTPKKTSYGIPLVTAKIVKNGRLEKYNEFIAEKDYDSWMVRGIPKKGDIVLTVEAPLGEVAQLDDTKIALAQRIVTLRGKEDILFNSYFLYLLQSQDMQSQLKSRASGSTVTGIKQSELRKVVLRLPSLPTQKKIAHILSTLDDKIELNRKMNQTLEAMAQALFKSWFVDFDPVHVKLTCKSEEELNIAAKKLGISKEILDLFPNEFEESELGMIPKGWKVESLSKIAQFQNGLALQKFRPIDGSQYLPVLKIAQLNKGYTDEEEKADININPECIVDSGDVVFSWSGTLLVDIWCGGKAALNQHLFKVTSKEFSKWFYYYWTKQHLFWFQHIAASKAVTMGHIKRSHLDEALCCVPSLDIFTKAEETISSLLEKLILNRLEIISLEKIRDTLLPKLLSGELDVLELELEI